MLFNIQEIPKIDCGENRHEWEGKGEVLVEVRFLFLRWTSERNKEVCKRCGKIEYSSTFSGNYGDM